MSRQMLKCLNIFAPLLDIKPVALTPVVKEKLSAFDGGQSQKGPAGSCGEHGNPARSTWM